MHYGVISKHWPCMKGGGLVAYGHYGMGTLLASSRGVGYLLSVLQIALRACINYNCIFVLIITACIHFCINYTCNCSVTVLIITEFVY